MKKKKLEKVLEKAFGSFKKVNKDTVIVSNDKGTKKLADGDKQLIKEAEAGEGIRITSMEQLMEMAKAAKATFDSFSSDVKQIMNPERATEIRKMRVDDGYSWRAVAQECYDKKYGEWQPSSNQLMGMALCEEAAKHFSEDYMKTPWNG